METIGFRDCVIDSAHPILCLGDRYLNVSGRRYIALNEVSDEGIQKAELKFEKPNLALTVLKIISWVSVVLPIIAAGLKFLRWATNSYATEVQTKEYRVQRLNSQINALNSQINALNNRCAEATKKWEQEERRLQEEIEKKQTFLKRLGGIEGTLQEAQDLRKQARGLRNEAFLHIPISVSQNQSPVQWYGMDRAALAKMAKAPCCMVTCCDNQKIEFPPILASKIPYFQPTFKGQFLESQSGDWDLSTLPFANGKTVLLFKQLSTGEQLDVKITAADLIDLFHLSEYLDPRGPIHNKIFIALTEIIDETNRDVLAPVLFNAILRADYEAGDTRMAFENFMYTLHWIGLLEPGDHGHDSIEMLDSQRPEDKHVNLFMGLYFTWKAGTNPLDQQAISWRKKATQYLTNASQLGSPFAQSQLSYSMMTFEVTDPEKCTEAAERGSLFAQSLNAVQSLSKLESLASSGVLAAGALMLSHHWRALSWASAYQLVEQGLKRGCPMSTATKGDYFQCGHPIGNKRQHPKDPEQAFTHYLKASKLGCVSARRCVADCYHKGVGVTRDLAMAWKYYTEAAELGDLNAQNALRIWA